MVKYSLGLPMLESPPQDVAAFVRALGCGIRVCSTDDLLTPAQFEILSCIMKIRSRSARQFLLTASNRLAYLRPPFLVINPFSTRSALRSPSRAKLRDPGGSISAGPSYRILPQNFSFQTIDHRTRRNPDEYSSDFPKVSESPLS